MQYTDSTAVSNSAPRFNNLDTKTDQRPSLACRVISSRFHVPLSTATLLAEAAGLPQIEEC